MLIAGGMVALAVYEQPTGTYQIVRLDYGNVARINTRTGAGELCGLVEEERRCVTLFDQQGRFLPKLEQERNAQKLLEQIRNESNEAAMDG